MNSKISLAVHGGAGTILQSNMTPAKEAAYKNALQDAIHAGYGVLENHGSALEAVEAAVVVLENTPLFNAGKGAVFTHDGKHEMDASIMCGKTLDVGAVSLVHNIKNPIALARLVMTHSEHVLLAGEGAMIFAKNNNVVLAEDAYFYDQLRYDQLQEALKSNTVQLDHAPLNEKKFGTVGAVARDAAGNLAAATSTGGMTNKKFGRMGDSPIIGAGTYANNHTCAVSCTGSGEYFMRAVVAYDVSCLMEYKGFTLAEACEEVVQKKLVKLGGDGGLIAVDAHGNVALPFNTSGMYRGFRTSDGGFEVAIY